MCKKIRLPVWGYCQAMSNIFKDISSSISMRDIAEFYGFKVSRQGFICCPFHSEKTPSCKLYEHSFCCFGCGEKGDIIRFVQLLFNLSPIQSAQRINSDFMLHYEFNTQSRATDKEIAQFRKIQKAKADFVVWENNAFNTIRSYLRLLKQWRREYADTNDKRFFESLEKLDYIQYLCDILTSGNLKDKQYFYLCHRQEVDIIAERLQQLNNKAS